MAIPVMSRVFTPEDYSILTLYLSITGVFVLAASGRLEIAIPLAKDTSDAKNLVILALSFALLSSVLMLVIIAIAHQEILEVLDLNATPHWLWLTPLGTFVTVLFQIYSYWCTRRSLYRRLAIAKIITALGTVGIPLLLLNYSSLSGGNSLVIGYLFASLFAVLVPNIGHFHKLHAYILSAKLTKPAIIKTLVDHQEFPKRVFSTAFLNGASKVAIFFSLQIFFGQYWAGLLALTERVVVTPLRIASTSLWQVTHASLANLSQRSKEDIFERVHLFICIGFGFPLSLIAALSGYASDIFGDQWAQMASLLPPVCLMAYFNAVSNSTSYFTAFGFFKAESVVNIALVSARIGALAFGILFLGASETVIAFCTVSALAYLAVNAFWGRKLRRLPDFARNLFLGGIAPAIASFCLTLVITHTASLFCILAIGCCLHLTFSIRALLKLKATVDQYAV